MPLIVFDLKTLPSRLLALVIVVAASVLAVFALIRGFANSASSSADVKEVGALLAWVSPDDPQARFASAVLHESSFEPGDQETAILEYEAAAANSPHNYLIWLELGTARGRAGDFAGAETAFRRAVELAPNYARVHWALGNFLLREGKDDEAYDHLRQAIRIDSSYAAPAAGIALQMADGNPQRVIERFDRSPIIAAELSVILAKQERFDEAVALWDAKHDSLNDSRLTEAAKKLHEQLFAAKRFRLSARMVGRFTPTGSTPPAPEQISNPGFEEPIKMQNAGHFDWKVPQGGNPKIGVTEAHKSSGRFSLIASLNKSDAREFHGPTQTVAVEPGQTYVLRVNYRADLKSKATFHWALFSMADGKQLSISHPITTAPDWTSLETQFTVPADTDGVEVRLVRGDCSGSACTADGAFWFDDLELKRN